MRKIGRDALRRALKITGGRPGWGENWEEAAMGAVYHCQMEALRLRPWQPPPYWASDDKPRDPHPTAGKVAAWEPRRRLIAAGLSVYEPDPVRALEAVRSATRGDDRVGSGAQPPTLSRTGPAG
jgi:hypothetical protein